MPAVSVVLPIYNAGLYLRQCLDSICNQTLSDIEVICVNDGSKDDSLSIMNEYAKKDDRFIVLDKPNGGYGHSLNYGLSRATGEYISIVEPDDFLDLHMYEDLYDFAQVYGSEADVVKGSYWEFYDGRDGYADAVREANITKEMPNYVYAFALEDDCEVFRHHPCIWSAIYRKAFLDEKGIRFIEPKGAGWADNPFLVETLVEAKKIVWVPKAYYYYRQTNAAASSFLKDYLIPFDRMRDMREILHSKNISNNNTWAAFYQREFNYIRSIVGEFGFSEADPEIDTLICEVLDDMKEEVVLSNEYILRDSVRYYLDYKAIGGRREDTSLVENPDLTVVVPLNSDGGYVHRCYSSLAPHLCGDVELIFVDCASSDRGAKKVESLVGKSGSIRLLSLTSSSVAKGINLALAKAKGMYSYILSPKTVLKDSVLFDVAKWARSLDLDVVAFDQKAKFAVDAKRCTLGGIKSSSKANCSEPLLLDVDKNRASDFLLCMAEPDAYARMYKTAFIKTEDILFSENEELGDSAFGMRAISKAVRVGYAGFAAFEKLPEERIESPCLLALEAPKNYKERAELLPSLLAAVIEVYGGYDSCPKSARSLILEAFIADLQTRLSLDSIRGYSNAYSDDVESALRDIAELIDCCDPKSFEIYQLLVNDGVEGAIQRLREREELDAQFLKKVITELEGSMSFKAGVKVVELGKKIVPSTLVDKLRLMMVSGANER